MYAFKKKYYLNPGLPREEHRGRGGHYTSNKKILGRIFNRLQSVECGKVRIASGNLRYQGCHQHFCALLYRPQ
jgi:hypothetical protein